VVHGQLLILPSTVLFALYPGLVNLTMLTR
jgi:hypothetical protein